MSRVTQQVEERLELGSSHPHFCLLSLHICFLGFSHPGLLPAHSTSLCSPLPRLCGSPTGLTSAGSRNAAAPRCGSPQGVPRGQTWPALTPEHPQPSCLSVSLAPPPHVPSTFTWSQSRPTLAHAMPVLRKQHPFREHLTAGCRKVVVIHCFC